MIQVFVFDQQEMIQWIILQPSVNVVIIWADSYRWKSCIHLEQFEKLLSRMSIFTARKRSLGQGYVFTPVWHSVHRRGRGRGVCPIPEMQTPQMQTTLDVDPPDADPPGCKPPPEIHGILRDTVNNGAVRILLECILFDIKFSSKFSIYFHNKLANIGPTVKSLVKSHAVLCTISVF